MIPGGQRNAELGALIAEMGEDEIRVMTYLAKRLVMGQRQYGVLDLANDKRDWAEEGRQESADRLMYYAFQDIKNDGLTRETDDKRSSVSR